MRRPQKRYTDDDRYVAIAALKLNEGNVYRTAIGLDIPVKTLAGWWKNFNEGSLSYGENPLAKERRGNLAVKLEDRVHSIIESITPEVIHAATLSQRAVAFGIAFDKLRLLRAQEFEVDPHVELCKLLGITPDQLPERLELKPGQEIPEDSLHAFGVADAPGIVSSPESTIRFRHPSLGDLTKHNNQSRVLPGFVRFIDVEGAIHTLPESSVRLVEAPVQEVDAS